MQVSFLSVSSQQYIRGLEIKKILKFRGIREIYILLKFNEKYLLKFNEKS